MKNDYFNLEQIKFKSDRQLIQKQYSKKASKLQLFLLIRIAYEEMTSFADR